MINLIRIITMIILIINRYWIWLCNNWGGILMLRTLIVVGDNEGKVSNFDRWLLTALAFSEE
jgi:hypothetical protein